MKHPKEERTYVMIKPDGVRKGLIGEVIKRFEQRDLKIIAIEMFQPTHELINDHYPKKEEYGDERVPFVRKIIDSFSIDEIEEMFNAVEKGKNIKEGRRNMEEIFLSKLNERGIILHTTERELDEFLAKPIPRPNSSAPNPTAPK